MTDGHCAYSISVLVIYHSLERMAPSKRGKKGPPEAAEFPKDTYAVLPDELSQLNEVRFTLRASIMGHYGPVYAARYTLARGFYILSNALSHLRRLLVSLRSPLAMVGMLSTCGNSRDTAIATAHSDT